MKENYVLSIILRTYERDVHMKETHVLTFPCTYERDPRTLYAMNETYLLSIMLRTT